MKFIVVTFLAVLLSQNILAATASNSEVGPAVVINRTVDFAKQECLNSLSRVNAASKTYSCNLFHGSSDLSVKVFEILGNSQRGYIAQNCKVILQFGQSSLKVYVSHKDRTTLSITQARKCFAQIYNLKLVNNPSTRSFKALVVY